MDRKLSSIRVSDFEAMVCIAAVLYNIEGHIPPYIAHVLSNAILAE